MNTKTIMKKCQECKKSFRADPREVNRGNANFCSLSCVATHTNRTKLMHRPTLELKCPQCGDTFKTKAPNKIYCSRRCKQQFYYKKISYKSYPKQLKNLPCEICGWHKTTCDYHHIISPRSGGNNDLNNLIIVCPNHHRLIHRNLISQDDLIKIVKSRTISSSATAESDALAGN